MERPGRSYEGESACEPALTSAETSDQVKAELELLTRFQELETSAKKPGRIRKFFSGLLRDVVLKHLAKDPGGKSRYKWADKAFIMRHELKLDYSHIYPAICLEATGKPWEELTDSEKEDFATQCRGLVYQRRVDKRNESRRNVRTTDQKAAQVPEVC